MKAKALTFKRHASSRIGEHTMQIFRKRAALARSSLKAVVEVMHWVTEGFSCKTGSALCADSQKQTITCL